ncbi:MAG: sensor histidine kinase [Niastella sp.]|nr:sensor histidine kinase [Niastella sp.]
MRLLLFLVVFSLAVPAPGQSFDQRQADSLKRVLAKANDGRTRGETLLYLAAYHIRKTGEIKSDLDSADAYMAIAERLNKSIQSTALAGHLLFIKGLILTERGKKKEGQTAVEQSIPLLQTSNSQRILGMAYFELQGYYDYWDTAQCRKRIGITGLSVKAFHEAGDKVLEGNALTMQGDLHCILNEYATSNVYLEQALAIYNSIGYPKLQGVYELLGRNCYSQHDYRSSFQYTLLALKAAQATHDSSMQLVTVDLLLATLYRKAGRSELSLGYFTEGLAIAVRHKDASNALLMAYALCLNYLDLHQPRQALQVLNSLPAGLLDTSIAMVKARLGMVYMRAYYADKQFNHAHTYSVILEKLVEQQLLGPNFATVVYVSLAWYHLEEHATARARFYLNKSLGIPLSPSTSLYNPRLEMIYRLDSAEGNYKAAFYSLRTYKTDADSLSGEVNRRQLQQLDIEYETSKKADSISLLTQKNHLQHANLRQANLIRNITIAGIVLALAVLGLLYRQYQLKLQNNTMMAVKNERLEHLVNEKEWLLQEVNHRVKNNLQTVVSLLEMQSDSLSDDAQVALQTSQNRVYATSLLYQKLYRGDHVSSVNMKVYLTELVEHLRDALSGATPVAMVLHVEPVELDVSQGVPVGLMVNELITNSFKYAFDATIAHPAIAINFTIVEGVAHLVINDNGIGFTDPDESQFGQGLNLVKGLAENMGGEVVIVFHQGTSVQIRFNPKGSLAISPLQI